MNARERYLSAFNGGKPDRVPTFVQGVKEDFIRINEERLFDKYTGPLVYNPGFDAAIILGFDAVFAAVPPSVSVNPIKIKRNGSEITVGESGQLPPRGSYYGGGAVTSVEIIEELYNNMKFIDNTEAIRKTVKHYNEIGDKIFPVIMVGGIFDRVWQAMGFRVFAREFRKKTSLYRKTVEYFYRITEANVRGIIEAVGKKAYVINILDDIAFKGRPMISPERWRDDFMPLYKKINSIITDAGVIPQLHTDGDPTDLLPYIIEAGFRGLQGWEGGADPYYVAEHYPDFTVIGFGDVSDVLPFGDKEKITEHVRNLMNALKNNGRFICGPSTVITSSIPYDNIRIFMEAVRKLGKY